MSYHGIGWDWGTHGSPVVVDHGHPRSEATGWALMRDGSCRPMGADAPPAPPDLPGPPPDAKPFPTWAIVGLFGGLLVVAGIGIYYRYKLMSGIVEKHGVGKALAFEAGEEAIGVFGSRMRRNQPRGYRYRYMPGYRPGEGHLMLERAPPGWKAPRAQAGIRKSYRRRGPARRRP